MSVSNRPKHLNLFQIRLPLPGFVSILHRVSGFGMFVFAAAILWLLQSSLQSPETFEQARQCAQSWIGKLFLTGLLCALVFIWVKPLAAGWFFAGMLTVMVVGWVGLAKAIK